MENNAKSLIASFATSLRKQVQGAHQQPAQPILGNPYLTLTTDKGKLYRAQSVTRMFFIAVAAAYLITAGFSLYSKSLALPFGWHLPGHSNSVAANSGSEGDKSAGRKPDTPWTYDFSKYPDGPLTRKDWNFEIGNTVADYNNEQQSYTPRTKNVRIENGELVIEAQKEQSRGKQYTSARINTLNKFDFTYGTIEADVRMPAGTGTWPAVWLMPSKSIYKASELGIPADNPNVWALNGEIDFAEAVGFMPGLNIPANHSFNEIQRAPTFTPAAVPTMYSAYHRYGVTKTPDKLIFSVDGKPYATRQKTSDDPREWPYNQPYYLIINLAMGGNWAGQRGIDDSAGPWQMKIRSISYRPL